MKIEDMRINGKTIEEAKLNGQVVYRKEQQELENIIYNADFRFGVEGFKKFVNMVVQQEIEDGYVAWIKMDSTNNRTSMIVQFTKDLIPGHSYYLRVTFKGSEDTTYIWEQQLNSPNLTQSYNSNNPDPVTISSVFRKITTQYRLFYNMRVNFSNAGGKAYMKEPMLIDVTELAKTMSDVAIRQLLDKMPFFADKTPPTYSLARIQSNNTDQHIATIGNNIWVYVVIKGPLATKPKCLIGGQEASLLQESSVSAGIRFGFRLTITEEINIPEGNIEFKVYGYADTAGNIGKDITETTDGTYVIFEP